MQIILLWLIWLTEDLILLTKRQGQFEGRQKQLEDEVRALREQRPE